jgi:hypothetical protein
MTGNDCEDHPSQNLPVPAGDCLVSTFLRQSRREVRDKIADLERSGDLSRLVERAAGTTVDEPDAMGFGEEDREPIAPERAKQQPQPG